jgi:hypothetical protein
VPPEKQARRPLKRTARLSFFLSEIARDNSGLLLSIRERRSAENAAPPRLNVGRLNPVELDSGQGLERHALQRLDARPLQHPLYPGVDVGAIGACLNTEIAQHQYARHEADVGD